jgi:hypothetical protein
MRYSVRSKNEETVCPAVLDRHAKYFISGLKEHLDYPV